MLNETIFSAPVEKLLEYSRKISNKNDVMRSLLSHRDWYAPALLVAGEPTRDANGALHSMVDKPIVGFSMETNTPANELWIFTDRRAAEIAQTAGAQLGLYAYNIAGTELFGKFDPRLRIVRINPRSPLEETWVIDNGNGFLLAKLWAEAIALEEGFGVSPVPDFKSISRFTSFTIFQRPNGYVVTLPNLAGMKNAAAAFTTPDCVDAFLSQMGDHPVIAESMRLSTDGLTLIKQLPLQEIDGMIFNVYGPGKQSYFAFSEIEDVNAL